MTNALYQHKPQEFHVLWISKGATRLALIYSLVISCRLNNIHTFTYFCDIVNRLTELFPTIRSDKLRELLPDRWTPNDENVYIRNEES